MDQATLAQEAALDGIRRHEDVRGLGMKMVLRGAQESEPLLADLEIAGSVVGIGRFIAVCLRITHKCSVSKVESPSEKLMEM